MRRWLCASLSGGNGVPKYYPVRSIKIVEVPVGTGDRDVSYPDNFDLGDRMSGTLGPVQTQDSIDMADMFVASNLQMQESFAVADALGFTTGPQLQDSIDIGDRLAGTLGPVRAPDTITIGDAPAIEAIVLLESLDISDAGNAELVARHSDSLNVQDVFHSAELVLPDHFALGESATSAHGIYPDSIDASDQLRAISGGQLADSIAIGDAANATISTSIPDSLDVIDVMTIGALMPDDSLNISDARQDGVITNARSWANAVVANTNFTTPNNLIDTSETTSADLTAVQSGGLVGGTSVTVNGSIEVSLPNPNIAPAPTISNGQVQAGWTTTASGGLQSGNSVSVAIDYSLNDGGAWTNLATVTTVAGTGDPAANVALTLTQLQQARFRAVGTVISGTTAIIGGATQTFSFRYCRIQFDASQTLP